MSDGNASTANGTIATDRRSLIPSRQAANGRFAPSPTGHLHLGSLVVAIASYLEARAHGGQWRLRIDDLDTARVKPGCSDSIIQLLERLGLEWDGPVTYQSKRLPHYRDALDQLARLNRLYHCHCSRKDLAQDPGSSTGAYPGTCREQSFPATESATRFRVTDTDVVVIDDGVSGRLSWSLRELGDVIVKRRDSVIAYQLAVVVDDELDGVRHVVRGADLLPSTAWQVQLQRCLGFSQPRYAHIPLVVEADGRKLSKRDHAIAVRDDAGTALLAQCLGLLRMIVPPGLEREKPANLMKWATAHWSISRLSGVREIRAPA
ncbi:MAG: tRNA glutamyl-Q(34) synthetase GluQRS [Steroidobacteraceae bacterium]